MTEELKYINRDYFNKGVLLLENGKYIFIEEIQYTYDGTYWESNFEPSEHTDPRNLNKTIPGHKYRRVRHAGDDFFQKPEYIVAEDGLNSLITVKDGIVYTYMEGQGENDYVELFKLVDVKGNDGNRGEKGEGWHVDTIGYYLEKPDCTAGLSCTTTCIECNQNSSAAPSTCGFTTFLSLGDGLYQIVIGDVGDFRSDDGVTWVEIDADDIGDYTRWTANDSSGTAAVDYRDEDTLNTRGKVYVCADGKWTMLMSVAIPRHKLSPTESYYISYQDGLYMEDYIYPLYSVTPDDGGTIVMNVDGSEFKLGIKMNSIEPKHLKDDIFSDGFNEGSVGPEGYKTSNILINTSDFAGYGLNSYTSSTDSYDDLQVVVSDFIRDGLQSTAITTVDGEVREKLDVNVTDLVDVSLSGLETFTNSDGYEDIKVKDGNGLDIDTDGLFVNTDNLSLYVSGDEVSIKPYTSGNDGVLANHLNPDVANINRAIILGDNGLEVTVSSDHGTLTYDSEGLLVKQDSIQGWHLNSNIVDVSKGLYVNQSSDMVEVKLNPEGGLAVDLYGIKIDTDDLSWLKDAVVNKIEIGVTGITGTTGIVDLTGDIVLNGDNSSDNYMTIEVDSIGQSIYIRPNTNLENLQSLIDSRVGLAGIGGHSHAISDVAQLSEVLDGKVNENTTYGNIKIMSDGLYISNPSGEWRKIQVDENFNLFTV